MEAIILAGGFGTRLQPVIGDIPKVMALINGRPFLEFLLNYLAGQNINKVILSVGYKNEAIQSYFGDRYKQLTIVYSMEEEPLGTGGGLRLAFQHVEGPLALAMNGDSMFRIDINSLYQFHLSKHADITLALKRFDDPCRYGSVVIDIDNRISGFFEKGEMQKSGLINGGIYLINKDFFMRDSFPAKFSLEKDFFEKQFKQSKIFGFPASGYFLDIGIPDDYYRAQDEFRKFED